MLLLWVAWTLLCLALAASIIAWVVFLNQYQNKIMPGVRVNEQPVGGLTKSQALELLSTKNTQPPETMVKLVVDDIVVASSSAELGLAADHLAAIDQAFQVGRSRQHLMNLWEILSTWQKSPNIAATWHFSPLAANKMIDALAAQVDIAGHEPTATLGVSGAAWSLSIDPGMVGRQVDRHQLTEQLLNHANKTSSFELTATVASTASQLNPEAIEAATQRAKNVINHSLLLRADNLTITLNDTEIIPLLKLPDGWNTNKLKALVTEWAQKIERAPQDAVFEYDPTTLKVTAFSPDRPGLSLHQEEAVLAVSQALTDLESTKPQESLPELQLPVAQASAAQPLSATNNLGIQERIGFGESHYYHSIPNRVHNVGLTADRINNVILPPGAEFSFNKTLGEVSSRTGFKSAYVIKSGRTELGDGGGVCQVSTTLFRSVLDAGLKVTKRKAHSYRVSYYEYGFKPGIDATVYEGDVDLRFVNDTNHHILIHTTNDSDSLYMTVELYGTSDGRTTEIVDHKTWDYRPPLAPQYYDDPSLPPGRIKQIDWAASGIKASFTNVIKDSSGKVIRSDQYTSNYQPWAAKYLRGI